MTSPIRVFVGCSSGDDAESQAVLEHTLRAHASQPVELVWMQLSADPASPWSGWNTGGWNTPFTGLRWAIPEVCGFAGRAIYMDSDVILRGDVAELWAQPMPAGAFALVRGGGAKPPRTCVMVLDCAAARHWTPALKNLREAHDQHGMMTRQLDRFMDNMGQIPVGWNVVDLKGFADIDDPAIRLIHYSSIAHQPHLRFAVERLARRGRRHWYDGERFDHWRPELVALFERELDAAIRAGDPPESYEPRTPCAARGMRSYRGVRVKGFSA